VSGRPPSVVPLVPVIARRHGQVRPLGALPEEDATIQALRLLTCAAEFDSATGGINHEANLYPVVKLITQNGLHTVPQDRLKPLFESKVARHV
jgi:proteasome beta subunit